MEPQTPPGGRQNKPGLENLERDLIPSLKFLWEFGDRSKLFTMGTVTGEGFKLDFKEFSSSFPQ